MGGRPSDQTGVGTDKYGKSTKQATHMYRISPEIPVSHILQPACEEAADFVQTGMFWM